MFNQSPFDETWTEEQFAEEAGVSIRTVRRWRNARTGPPFIKIGNKIRYRVAAVREWIASHEREQPRSDARGRSRSIRKRFILEVETGLIDGWYTDLDLREVRDRWSKRRPQFTHIICSADDAVVSFPDSRFLPSVIAADG